MKNHKRPPVPVIVLVVLLIVGLGGWWWWSATRPTTTTQSLSGQVETTELTIAPAMAGRIADRIWRPPLTPANPRIRAEAVSLACAPSRRAA